MRRLFYSRKDPAEKIPGHFIADYSFSQLASALAVGTVIPKLTAYYQLPLALSNLIVGIPAALGFVEIFGGYWYNKTGKQMNFIRATALIWRLVLPMIFFSVLLPPAMGAVCMIGSFFLMWLFQHLGGPAYNAWMISSTKGLIKPNYYSMRDLVFIPIYTVMTLLSGILIDSTEKSGSIVVGFQIFGWSVLVFSILSLPYILKLLPPPPKKAAGETPSLLKCMMMPLRDKPYMRVLMFHVSWTFFSALWGNFAGIYQIRVLELNYLFVTVCITAAGVLRVIFIPIFARFADRFSWKTATLVSYGIMGLHCISWVFTTKENSGIMFPITTVLGTVPWAALGIGMFKYQIAYTHEDTRSVYFSISSTLCGIVAALSSVVCSAIVGILESSFSKPPFWIIFLIGALGVALTFCLIARTKYIEPDHADGKS